MKRFSQSFNHQTASASYAEASFACTEKDIAAMDTVLVSIFLFADLLVKPLLVRICSIILATRARA